MIALKRLNSCCMIFASTRIALIIITFYPANFAHFLRGGGGGLWVWPSFSRFVVVCWASADVTVKTLGAWQLQYEREKSSKFAGKAALEKQFVFRRCWFLGFKSLSFWRMSGLLIERSIPNIWIIIRWFSTACSFVFWGSHNSKSVIWMPTVNISENLLILL